MGHSKHVPRQLNSIKWSTKSFFKLLKGKSFPKPITHYDLKTLNSQESLVNLIKALAQAINIVMIKLLIEINMSLSHYVIAYTENQHNRIADEVN